VVANFLAKAYRVEVNSFSLEIRHPQQQVIALRFDTDQLRHRPATAPSFWDGNTQAARS
jgi:hypothetical protein